MPHLLLVAARNLVLNRRRTLLIGSVIAGVTALLVLMLALSNGVQEVLVRSATTLMTGHVNVGGFFKLTPGRAVLSVAEYRKVLDVIHRTVPELERATPRTRGLAKLVGPDNSIQVALSGIDLNAEPGLRQVLRVREGNLEDLSQPHTMLLFEEQATKLGARVGDTLTLLSPTVDGVSNTLDVRVAAIAGNVGVISSLYAFLPDASVRELYQLGDEATGAIHLYLKDIRQAPLVQERLREALRKEGFQVMDFNPSAVWLKLMSVKGETWSGSKLDVSTWEDEVSWLDWTLTVLKALAILLTFVLLSIISIGIMNVLWISIRERTQEIGTLRAIGMQRRQVMWMFLLEALVLGLSSSVAGAVVGLLACAGLNAAHVLVPKAVQLFLMSDTLSLEPDLGTVLLAVALITLCCMGASVLPVRRAAKLRPITAMQAIE